MSKSFESVEHVRKTQSLLNSAWWQAYRVKEKHPEIEAMMKHALDWATEEGKRLFAKPYKPDCDYCKYVSVFGGPGHDPSPRCRSGKQPHCTCDTCY